MTLPGTVIRSRETPPPRTAPTDTGVWFVCGLSEKGAVADARVPVHSLSQFMDRFGSRQSDSILYDAIESYFREGGGSVYISRVLGSAALAATLVLNDSSSAASLNVAAASPGAWGNGLKIQVAAGSGSGLFNLVISLNDVVVEQATDLVDVAAAVQWSQSSNYVTITPGSSVNDPAVVAATSLTGGTDDRVNVVDADWQAALDKFTRDLGPGQVSMPGRTTQAAHGQLRAHGVARNRVPICDAPDTPTVATLTTLALAQRGQLDKGDRFAGVFAPWIKVPGIISGTTRMVPPSAIVAGIISRNDGAGNSPNVPAAGENGQSVFGLDVSQTWAAADRETLNNAGVNGLRLLYGGVRVYGFRTLADPKDPNWIELSNARLYMDIANKAHILSEMFVFAEIDGKRRKIAEYGGRLTGLLLPYWQEGSLYGDAPEDAFNVEVGPQVNTPQTIGNRELHAVIALRMSPFAEMVILEIAKVPSQEAVA